MKKGLYQLKVIHEDSCPAPEGLKCTCGATAKALAKLRAGDESEMQPLDDIDAFVKEISARAKNVS